MLARGLDPQPDRAKLINAPERRDILAIPVKTFTRRERFSGRKDSGAPEEEDEERSGSGNTPREQSWLTEWTGDPTAADTWTDRESSYGNTRREVLEVLPLPLPLPLPQQKVLTSERDTRSFRCATNWKARAWRRIRLFVRSLGSTASFV